MNTQVNGTIDQQENDDRNKLTLIVVVGGTPEHVEVNVHSPLRTVIPLALIHHPGQPPENWELRDATGNLLDLDRKIEDYHFAPETTLFLNLKAGVGG